MTVKAGKLVTLGDGRLVQRLVSSEDAFRAVADVLRSQSESLAAARTPRLEGGIYRRDMSPFLSSPGAPGRSTRDPVEQPRPASPTMDLTESAGRRDPGPDFRYTLRKRLCSRRRWNDYLEVRFA